MRLIYDNLIYSLQIAGGISTYWSELSKRLIRDGTDVGFVENQNDNIVRKEFSIDNKQIIKDFNFTNTINRFLAVPLTQIHQKFIFHSSYNRITNNPDALQVVTVHDFVHEQYYRGLRKFLHSYQKNKALLSADKIIAISQNTKNDLLKFHPSIRPDKIHVIYNGVSEDFYPMEKKVGTENRPYLLFIGSREPYKNFAFAVKALNELPDFDLCIVGSSLIASELRDLNKYLPGRWHLFNKISNQILNEVYNDAYGLIYPSSYEGFGIPLLEAMKCGTPFIAFKRSSIPEVAGEAGILLDELDLDSFKKAILSIDSNRTDLSKKGFDQVKKFSWEKCYQDTLDIYKELY